MKELTVKNETFHLLFADPGDLYFTHHWLGLSYEQRVYQVLCQEGYENVYFFKSLLRNKSEVLCVTEAGAQRFRKLAWGPLNEGILWLKKDCPPFVPSEEGNGFLSLELENRVILGTIREILREKTKDHTAFVFRMDDFSEMMSDSGSEQMFSQMIRDYRCKDHGSLFLLGCGREIWDRLPMLPETLASRQEQDRAAKVNGDLKAQVDELSGVRMTSWEAFGREQLERMLHRLILEAPNSSLRHAEKNAAYLYHVLREEKADRVLGHRIRKQRDLYELLSDTQNFNKLRELVKGYVV